MSDKKSAVRRGCAPVRARALTVHALSVLVFVGTATACRTWQPTSLSPERLIAEERPERVRVTVPGGAQVTLRNPIVVNDSIVAAVAQDPGAPFATARPGVPAASVEGLEVARLSKPRTIALGLGIVAASLGWARIASDTNAGEPPPVDPLPKGLRPRLWDGIRIVWRIPR